MSRSDRIQIVQRGLNVLYRDPFREAICGPFRTILVKRVGHAHLGISMVIERVSFVLMPEPGYARL
jgi:hypothetical protein